MRLSADELARRLPADWQLALRVGELAPGRLAEAHPLVSEGELAPLGHLLAAAAHLAELERRLAGTSCRELVEEVYPAHFAPVSELLSRAELASVGGALVSVEAIDAVSAAGRRLLGVAEAAFRNHQRAGFAGSLRIWEVGRIVLQPLLATHGRVAVLMVDAMRADLWNRLHDDVASALAGRTLRQKWAVVPEPTRTTEAVAALYLGRPVPRAPAQRRQPIWDCRSPISGTSQPRWLAWTVSTPRRRCASCGPRDRKSRWRWPRASMRCSTGPPSNWPGCSTRRSPASGGGCGPHWRRCPLRSLWSCSPTTASGKVRRGDGAPVPAGPTGACPSRNAWFPWPSSPLRSLEGVANGFPGRLWQSPWLIRTRGV